MRIKEIKTHILRAPMSEAFAYSQMWVRERVGLIVEITTDDGVTGWGESYGPPGPIAAVVEAFAPHLRGLDPCAGEAIWENLYNRFRDHGQKGIVIQALSGVDIGLWDLRGKYFNAPIHRLLGGPVRDRIQAYATGLYRREGDNAVLLAEEAAGYVAEGFKAMKVKIGFDFKYDLTAIRAVRAAIGPDITLMMDANHGYDATDALRLARAAEEYDIAWFEEPVPPEDLDGYCRVRDGTTIPVAGGEAEFTRFGFRDMLRRCAADILQPDTCAAGGISECKKIADMAVAYGVRYNPHVWGTGIAIAASLHLLAVLPTTVPRMDARQPMLELDRTEHSFRQAILTKPIDHEGGIVAVPEGPGLGIEIDRDTLARYAI